MTLEKQRAGYMRELDALNRACSRISRRMHWCTVYDALRDAGLPYILVQDTRNQLGEHIRGYRYQFATRWGSDAMLYIQETDAGRRQYRSMGAAIDALRTVLTERLAGLCHHVGRSAELDGNRARVEATSE